MFKKLATASCLASLLAVTGCSLVGTTAGNDGVDVTADCITEVTRISGTMNSDEIGSSMFEYWKSEPEVVRPFVRAAMINQQLPTEWNDRFETEVEKAFTEGFTAACVKPGATIESASIVAADWTNNWIDLFMDRLEEAARASMAKGSSL